MDNTTRGYLIAALVILIIILIIIATGYWWWKEDGFNFMITNVAISSTGSLALTGTTTSKSDPSTWVGLPIIINIKSLGSRIHSKVAQGSTATMITTDTGAYAGTSKYVSSPDDYAHVILKYY